MKLFALNRENNPSVIMPRRDSEADRTSWEAVTILGKFHRVFPTTAKEISAIRMLEHRSEKFAPAHGDGVIITDAVYQNFNS